MRQEGLAAMKRLFRSFLILDIGVDPAPFDDPPGSVRYGTKSELKPTVLAIETPQARLCAPRLMGSKPHLPIFQQLWQILGMHGSAPSQANDVILRKAAV